MNYTIEFSFSSDPALNFTCTEIVQNSLKFTEQRSNSLKSSSSSISLQIYPDRGLLYQRLFQANESDIQAVLKKGNSVVFTGYVSRNITWSVGVSGAQAIDILLEDTGLHKFKQCFVPEDGVGVYDTPMNIITAVCTLSGVSLDTTGISQGTNPELYVNIAKKLDASETCESVLTDILYELGYVYYFDAAGIMKLQKIDLTQTPVQLTEADLYDVNGIGITLSSQVREYTSTTVKYSEVRTRSGVNIYQVDTSDSFINLDNISNLWWDGEFHDSTETPAPGQVEMTDIDAGNEIIYLVPNTLVPTMTPATSSTAANPTPTLQQRINPDTSYPYRGTDKVEVLIDNTTALKPLVSYSAFQAKGTVITMDENTTMTVNDGSFTGKDRNLEYSTSWIHDKDRAQALAERTTEFNLYCNNTYTFYSVEDLGLGTTVTVTDDTFSHSQITLYLTGRTYTRYWFSDYPCYKYTGQAISPLVTQFVPQTTTISVRPQYSVPQYTYIRYSAYSDGKDPDTGDPAMTEEPQADSKYMGTYTGTSASCPDDPDEFTWIQYVYGDVSDFRLNVSPANLVADRRRTDSQTITISTVLTGYTGTPTIKYWYGDGDPDDPWEIVADSVVISLPYDHKHPSLNVVAELDGAPTQSMVLMTIDETEEYLYFGECSIDTSGYYDAEGQPDVSRYSQVDWSEINDQLGSNEKFLDGDSFFNHYSETTPTDFNDVYIYVYQLGYWVPINFSNYSNSIRSRICMQAQKDVLSTIETGSVAQSDFGYFNTIIAGTVTADYIGGKEIEVHDGGFIYAGDVDLNQSVGHRVGSTGAGFCFDSQGNAEMSNIRITGDSTIEGGSTVLGTLINYDTANPPKPVFKTVKETDIQVSMAGSKTDGTNTPNAYIWSSFTEWLKNSIIAGASSGTYYSASGTIYANWSGSIVSRSVIGIRYWPTVPTTTNTFQVNGDRGAGTVETKTMYVNNNAYNMTFHELAMHPKTDHSIWGVTGYGELKVTTYTSGGSVYQVLCNQGEIEGNYGAGMAYAYNVVVPPGGYIVAEAGTYSGHPLGQWDTDLYITFKWAESDMFSDGINFVLSGGSVSSFNSVMPTTSSFSTYPQSLTCSGLSISLSMTMSAASNWPVEKYYRFSYSTSPGISSAITTSIFSSQSFSYRGNTRTVASITYSNTYLKVIDTFGQPYEFYTSQGYYYPRHSFSFTTLGESLGAYMRSVLPTDDPNTHDVGASGTYSSGVSQRWSTGYFTSLDVSQGIYAQTINAGWNVPIITANYTITEDIPVGFMRPYFINSSGTVNLTMPGNSSQNYVILAFNVITAVLVAAGKNPRYIAAAGGSSTSITWTSSAEPYMLVYVIRLS